MIEEKHLLKKNAPAKRLRQTNNVGAIKNMYAGPDLH